MANYIVDDDDWVIPRDVLKESAFDAFNPSILGLGNLKKRSTPTSALAAVFDLEGFTNFCRQIDPHLAVPNYLGQFIPWLLNKIKDETVNQKRADGYVLWHDLPFFTKFLGDGLLLLWNTESMNDVELENIIVSLHTICRDYQRELLGQLKNSIVDPPSKLRCGIARGTVFSVGDDADYVGSCINMAARLQKLPGVSFAFNRRGFDLERKDGNDHIAKRFVVRKVTIRGIGENELIAILSSDIALMSQDDLTNYREP